MYALIGTWKMDPAKKLIQIKQLHERIVPMVKHQPEFLCGYWSEDGQGRNQSFLVWATEDAARGFEAFVRQNGGSAEAGVELESLTVVHVLADARA